MTDTQTPERLCYVNCGLPLLECRCYRENFQHWPQPVSPAPEGYVPASVHAALVAERDQLKENQSHLIAEVSDRGEKIRKLKAKLTELEKHRG